MRFELDSFAQIKSAGPSGWTLRTKTNQLCLLKLLTLAEQEIFQEEPKGFTDMDMLTLGPWGSRSSTSHVCTQVTAGQAHSCRGALTVKCQKKQSCLQFSPIPRTFNTSFLFSLEKSQFLLCIRRTISFQEWDHLPA